MFPYAILPVVKVDAFSKIDASSLGRLIREVDAMLRPGGVLYVRFSIHCNMLQLICMNV